MKSRFREYRHRLVQNQARKDAVLNADPYRDERGRFARAVELTREALASENDPDSAHLMRLALAAEGMSNLHHEVARAHQAISNNRFILSGNRTMGDSQRRRLTGVALAHHNAAQAHRAAAERINNYAPAPNPLGFSHLDRSERLIWADWLDDHGHAELAHHMRVYSS